MVKKRKCLICGKEFKPTIWNRKYCSEECSYVKLIGNIIDDTYKNKGKKK